MFGSEFIQLNDLRDIPMVRPAWFASTLTIASRVSVVEESYSEGTVLEVLPEEKKYFFARISFFSCRPATLLQLLHHPLSWASGFSVTPGRCWLICWFPVNIDLLDALPIHSVFPPSLPSSFPLFCPPSLGSLPETHQLPQANSEIVSARYRLRPSPVPSYTHQGIVGSVQLLRVGGTSVPLDSSRPEGRPHRSYRFTCSANNCSDIPPLNRDKGLRECLIRELYQW